MMSRPQLAAVVLLAIGVFIGAIWISGGTVSLDWATYLGGTITVVAGAITVFNLWLWRLNFLQGWFVKRPHIWGEWKAAIRTEWVDPTSGQRQEPVDAKLAIRQTYGLSDVSVCGTD